MQSGSRTTGRLGIKDEPGVFGKPIIRGESDG